MVDRQFAGPALAALYDAVCPWQERGDFGFYLPLVMSAGSVLDVGCGAPEVGRSILRFPGADAAAEFLDGAGLDVEEHYGDWDRAPLTAASPEIITIARRR